MQDLLDQQTLQLQKAKASPAAAALQAHLADMASFLNRLRELHSVLLSCQALCQQRTTASTAAAAPAAGRCMPPTVSIAAGAQVWLRT